MQDITSKLSKRHDTNSIDIEVYFHLLKSIFHRLKKLAFQFINSARDRTGQIRKTNY